MLRILSTLVLLVLCTLLISCGSDSDQVAQQSPQPGTTEAWSIADVPVGPDVPRGTAVPFPAARVQFPGGVSGYPNLIYSDGAGGRPRYLDMFIPADDSTVHPLVMFIHGGGWSGGNSRSSGAFENWPATLAMIASRGYVVASINYRLSGEAAFPASIYDVKIALRWLRANANDYGIDKENFLVWGPSAGGHLAALAGTSCGVAELEPQNLSEELAAESDCVQATIGWYGIFDLSFMAENGGPSGYFLGQTGVASPSTHVESTDGPFLLIHGANDQVADPSQSENFHALLLSKGVSSDIHIIPDVDHSFVGPTAEITKAASILALEISMAFIDEVFK